LILFPQSVTPLSSEIVTLGGTEKAEVKNEIAPGINLFSTNYYCSAVIILDSIFEKSGQILIGAQVDSPYYLILNSKA